MIKFKEVIDEIKKNIIPSDKEVKNIKNFAEEMRIRMFEIFSDILEEETDVFLAGSVARGTFLKGESDIDIFLRFSPEYKIDEIENYLFQRLYQNFPKDSIRKRYAEHPYAELVIKDKKLNIVPCFKTKYPNWLSPVDRSYYHNLYLRDKVKDIREEIIIAKAFLKGVGVYGAEVYIGGFSGYLTELLVYHYKSFSNLIKNVARWHPPVIIDIEKHFSSRKDIVNLFGISPLIVIDPVDKGRNVAAAVSERKFSSFISASKAFLRSPKKEYFYRFTPTLKVDYEELERLVKKLSILAIDLRHKPRIEDIHYPQLQSLAKKIVKQLEIHGFKVIKFMGYSNFKSRSIIFILVESYLLPEHTISTGPYPYYKGEAEFINKNKMSLLWIGLDGRWYALKERKFNNALKLIKNIIETPLIKIPKDLYDKIDIYLVKEGELKNRLCDNYIEWLNIFLKGEEFWIYY